MSQKIITKILNFAASEGADNLVITKRSNQLILDCYFSEMEKRSLVLPKRLEQKLFSSLRKMLSISPGDLTAQKYCKLEHSAGCLNFYLTILPEANGEKIIINLIKKPTTLWRLNQLGLERKDLQDLKKSLTLKSGLIIISSPEAAGRSATLNSLLLGLSDTNKSVYALAKHHSFEVPGIASLAPTAANWEKILRLDSEIIFADDLVGTRDLENAIRAAASGRLVFGTIKADNSFSVLTEILKIKLPLKLKLDSLKMIVNQRLAVLKRKASKTKRDERQEIGLFEILKITPAIKKFLIEAQDNEPKNYLKELEKLAIKDGFNKLN